MSSDSLNNLTIDKTMQLKPAATRTRLRLVVAIIIIAAVALLIVFVKSRSVSIETTTVSQIYPTQSFTKLNASGYVVAQRKAAVASKITGRLEWIGVQEGDRVKAGQIIARLENRDLDSSARQAEASVQSAKASLEQVRAEMTDAAQSFRRQKELLAQGIVSQAEFDTADARNKRAIAGTAGAEAALRVSSEALQGARITYDYSLIRAPFDAVVLTKNADVGDIITPLGAAANAKAAVVTIADMRSLQVEADVSESNLGMVSLGQPCEISLDSLPNTRFRGTVHTVVPTADRSKASVMVKVAFVDTDTRILPEMSAKVAFLEREANKEDRQQRIAINPAAIIKVAEREGVYLLKGDTVVFTPVVRGIKLGDMVEVSGVKAGDKIALRPLDKLKDGSRVSLPEKK